MVVDRYMTAEMREIWSKQAELKRLCTASSLSAQVSGGLELKTAVDEVCDSPQVNVVRWAELEEVYDHDIAAFVEMIRQELPVDLRDLWHRRRTSSDLVETALAEAINASFWEITLAKRDLARALARRAHDNATNPVMGRTHGQEAEPTTIGRKLAIFAAGLHTWYFHPYQGAKVSGPVGTDNSEEQRRLVALAGYQYFPATQIMPRWVLADSISQLLGLVTIVSSLATEIRLASQSGVEWLRERSPSEQARGSSAMPHKRNPIRSERAVGLAKVIRHDVYAVIDAGAELWNERDISHSSVERTALVEAFALTHFLLKDMAGVVDRLEIYPPRAAIGTDGATGVGTVEALVAAGRTYSLAYEAVKHLGPGQAARTYNVDGRGFAYDPASEPALWERITELAGRERIPEL